MAELFQKDVRTISEHIQSIYAENELDVTPTIRKFRIVQTEGERQVTENSLSDFDRAVKQIEDSKA